MKINDSMIFYRARKSHPNSESHYIILLSCIQGQDTFVPQDRHYALNECLREATSLQWIPHVDWYTFNPPFIPSDTAPKTVLSGSLSFHDHLHACFLHQDRSPGTDTKAFCVITVSSPASPGLLRASWTQMIGHRVNQSCRLIVSLWITSRYIRTELHPSHFKRSPTKLPSTI